MADSIPSNSWMDSTWNSNTSPNGLSISHPICPPITDAADFQTRLNDLPREIFDMIEDLTFSAHIAQTRRFFNLSSPAGRQFHHANLKILQLSRATRGWYAEEIYWMRTVQFCTRVSLLRWLASVDVEHRAFIGSIEFVFVCNREGTSASERDPGGVLLAHIERAMLEKFANVMKTKLVALFRTLEQCDFSAIGIVGPPPVRE